MKKDCNEFHNCCTPSHNSKVLFIVWKAVSFCLILAFNSFVKFLLCDLNPEILPECSSTVAFISKVDTVSNKNKSLIVLCGSNLNTFVAHSSSISFNCVSIFFVV